MDMAMFNRWFTADALLWAAAATSFLLLVLTVPLASVLTSSRRDSTVRVVKILFYVVLILLFLLPCLVLLTGEAVAGLPCGLYLLFFPLFCFYLGRRIGHQSGARDMREQIGLDIFDNLEEAQDRLYESRLRFPSPTAVSESIMELSRQESPVQPQAPGSRKPSGKNRGESKTRVMDVEVEEV